MAHSAPAAAELGRYGFRTFPRSHANPTRSTRVPILSSLRVLELFCGIGGCAAALGQRAQVVAAVDINRTALGVYAHDFPHTTVTRTIESIPCSDYRSWEADLWWLSPPCQPYTRRGHQRDLADPRAAGLLSVIDRIGQLLPPYVALENVPPFPASQACVRLRQTLARCGYRQQDLVLCPTELGIPNRRRRYYLVAGRSALRPFAAPCRRALPLAQFSRFVPPPRRSAGAVGVAAPGKQPVGGSRAPRADRDSGLGWRVSNAVVAAGWCHRWVAGGRTATCRVRFRRDVGTLGERRHRRLTFGASQRRMPA